MAFEQREIAFLWKQDLVLARQDQHIVVASQVVERVSEIDGSVPVLRQLGEHFIAELSRFKILAGQEQVSFRLSHYPRIILQRTGRTINPRLGQRQLVIFERSIGSVGNDRGVLRSALISKFVVLLGLREFIKRRVHVSQSKIGNIVFGIGSCHTEEVFLRGRQVAHIASQIPERLEGKLVVFFFL